MQGEVQSIAGNTLGGLVGLNNVSASIQQSYSIAHVQGNNKIAAFVGENSGSINNVFSTSAVKGNELIGILIGSNTSTGSISNSYVAKGILIGEDKFGVLIGGNLATQTNSISNLYWGC